MSIPIGIALFCAGAVCGVAGMAALFTSAIDSIDIDDPDAKTSGDDELSSGEKIKPIETYSHIENIGELRERFPSIFK